MWSRGEEDDAREGHCGTCTRRATPPEPAHGMTTPLTVRDLTLPGEPLDGAQALTGEVGLDNPVVWVVSLRPFTPAFPRLRGGEIALVATENLLRHDPPVTLSDVVRLLASTGGAGIAVRGGVDAGAIQAAQQAELALLSVPADAPLADLEQAMGQYLLDWRLD